MKRKMILSVLLLTGSLPASAAMIDLTGIGYVTYGDFNSYSMPIAALQTGCANFNNSCPFYIQSGPGQIQDLVVVATGASGNPVNTNFAGMDNAYSTPSGVSGSNFFSTGTTADPNQVTDFFGDKANTWDSSLLALKNYLAGDAMAFFFNNNNLNGANLQSLAVWAQMEVTDDSGNRVGIFDFTNNAGAYGLVSEGGGGTFLGNVADYSSTGSGPMIGDNSATDYVLAGGPICINYSLIPGLPTPVSCNSPLAEDGPVNHNLGADTAAYAVIAPELNALLESLFALDDQLLQSYTLHIDFRMGCDPLFGIRTDEMCSGALSGYGKNINNGYEQLFIGTARINREPPPGIPEPGMLFMFSTGLLALRWRLASRR
ncbi:PEP-CTERM protein-sorting domain-containing protein [Rheinheimera pacifica]|uniref:PEP-CTERM protein-sorting domain-containing protein n=1 Tax=Rheinheimera pacifica TaxID=173990 RepID=A0A1H6N338_9GAMM|nr:hypothetical protein [Rheinheimera pacifica]SEI09077.1 PEP-CTERM protein-sorting domain-containing protein [Rheinheimera pacifica]